MNFISGVATVFFDPFYNVLLQHRAKEPGHGLRVLPGGRMDETDCRLAMAREAKEELGLIISPYDLTPCWFATDLISSHQPPVVMHYFVAFLEDPTRVKNMEPHKCYGLEWVPFLSPMATLPSDMWANDKSAIIAARNIARAILRPGE